MYNRKRRQHKLEKLEHYEQSKKETAKNESKLSGPQQLRTKQKTPRDINIDISTLNLIPQKIESESVEIPQNNLMEAGIIPSHPFSGLFVGMSGSGKTNSMIYIMNNYYKNYFDEILVMGQTVKTDKMYDHLEGLEDERLYTKDLVGEARRLLDEIKDECEKEGVVNAPRRLIIIEDATSQRKLIQSPSFVKLFVQARHLNCSVVCNVHKLRAVARAARINAVALFIFKPVRSDFVQIVEEYCPPSVKKDDFIELLNYSFTPTEEMVKPFLYFNRNAKDGERFKKGFSEILRIQT